MDHQDSGGAGTPVVFLHAATGHSAMWEHQLPAFTAAGYRCMAFDRSAEGFASDQLEALAAKLALPRFHLVGTAAGAIIAVDYALSHAPRLRSLVLANTIVGVQDADYLEMSQRLRPSPQFDKMPADFRELGPSYRAANATSPRKARNISLSCFSMESAAATSGSAAGASPYRRCRPLYATARAKDVRNPHQGQRIGGAAGMRPLRVLGAAGAIQPRRAGVSEEVLVQVRLLEEVAAVAGADQHFLGRRLAQEL